MLTAYPPETTRFHGGPCGPKLVRSSSGHEHPTSLGAAVSGGVEYRGDQCALQLAERSGSARDRRGWTAGASLSRRGCGRRGLCDGVLGGVGVRLPCGATKRAMCRAGWRRSVAREAGVAVGDGLISRQRLRSIELLKSQGMSNRAVAHRLGVSEKAIRKLVGPSTPAESAQLAFAGMTTAAAGTPRAAGVPSAKSTDDDEDGSAPSVKDGAGDPISAAEDDAEPGPMSLDRDASDRSFDRQLAHLGLLDDAAPPFREGASVPGVGVLLALPCLVESGLFQISRKLYGEIGPAFYGLRTTLLTLLLMALLRIKRPEHLKERDPAAFGRLLGLDRAPEVKTLRRRLTRLAAHQHAEQLGAELARLRVDQRGHLMGFLYIDGHVRAYHE